LQALLAAPAAIVLVEIVVLVVWLADRSSQASASTALRVGVDLWLLGHGGHLRLPAGPVTVIPLGITAVPLLLTARAGYRLALDAGLAPALVSPSAGPGIVPAPPDGPGARRRPIARCVAGVSLPYVTIALLVAVVADDPAARTGLVSAGLGAAAVSISGALAGIGLAAARSRRARGDARRGRGAVSAGAVAAAVYGAAGAIGLVACALGHAGRIAAGMSALRPGGIGGIGLVLTQVALLPNFVVWGAAYAAGAGFATGVTGSVSPLAVHPAALGELPILQVVPGAALPVLALPLLLVVPLTAGVLLGGVLRRSAPLRRVGGGDEGMATPGERSAALARLLVAAAVCGVVVGLAAWLSGGTIGSGELARFGPVPPRTGSLAALGAAAGAGARAIAVGARPRRGAG
jgi:hypothetical protein